MKLGRSLLGGRLPTATYVDEATHKCYNRDWHTYGQREIPYSIRHEMPELRDMVDVGNAKIGIPLLAAFGKDTLHLTIRKLCTTNRVISI